jgi:protein-S-isoprenylcysteine O-methyltransferase Ste14
MHILGEKTLGIAIFILLGALVIVKSAASGSILKEKPRGGAQLWLIHIFNLFFLLIVNPLTAILLVAHRLAAVDATHVAVGSPLARAILEACGIVLYVAAYALMAWALLGLGRSYQVGGNAPRSDDRMVMSGPYRLVRHPMYTAALWMSLGLACLTQSVACAVVFCIYLALISLLIPFEEEGLRRAYGERYAAYTRTAKKLIPFVY